MCTDWTAEGEAQAVGRKPISSMGHSYTGGKVMIFGPAAVAARQPQNRKKEVAISWSKCVQKELTNLNPGRV